MLKSELLGKYYKVELAHRGYRFIIQCYKEKPTNIDFNALDNYAVIYEADMVINNYQYLYNKEEAKKRIQDN